MMLARVEGNLVANRKHHSLEGWRLLVCQPIHPSGTPEGSPIVALDPLGAGLHEKVIVSTDGAAARLTVKDAKSPARMMIVGIVDEVKTKTTP